MTDTLYGIWGSTLTGIANAIRTKNPDVSGLVDPADMRQDILDIPSGGMPDKLLISSMNFKPTSTWRDDSARDYTLPQTNYSNIAQTDNVGISSTGRNASVHPSINFSAGMYYEVEINTGDNSSTTTFEQYNQLFKLNRTDSHFTLTYGRDIAYDGGTGRWRVSDQSGQNKFLSGGDGNPHYLDNKKITICYGFKYVNGERVANENRISWYVNNVLELEGTEQIIASTNNTPQLLLFGGNAMLGFIFEDLKVYQHFNINS